MIRIEATAYIGLAAGLTLVCACGDIETTPAPGAEDDDSTQRPVTTGEGLIRAAEGLAPDTYEIGSSWYDYNGASHVLTPKERVYAFRRNNDVALLAIESYYDDRGDSGIFTLETMERAGDDAQYDESAGWTTPERHQLSGNVKDERVCVSLWPTEEVSCDDSAADLVFRTNWRPVPGAGFAVANPALFTTAHFTQDPVEHLRVSILPDEVLELPSKTPREVLDLEPQSSASVDPTVSRVGWKHGLPEDPPRTDLQLQVTARMQIVQWQLAQIEPAQDQIRLGFRVLCQAASFEEQSQFEMPANGEVAIEELAISSGQDYTLAYVQLCGEDDTEVDVALVEEHDVPQEGLWPDSKTFDLIVEQWNGRIAIRPAPSNLLWNWTRANPSDEQIDGAEPDPDDSELKAPLPFEPINLSGVWEALL